MIDYFIKIGDRQEENIFTTYGVRVSGTEGLVGKPSFKEPRKYSWSHLNGEWVDLSARRYKPRTITLHCWIKATSSLQVGSEGKAVEMMNEFMSQFDAERLVRLRVRFDGVDHLKSNLYYLVYLDSNTVKYKWRNANKQIVKFDITLVEQSPEKLLFKRAYAAGTVSVLYSSRSEFDIDWGDGTSDYDLFGNNKTVTHTYTGGTYIIIVSGVLKDISITVPDGAGGGSDDEEEER